MTKRTYLDAQAQQGDLSSQAELESLPELTPHGAHLWAYFVDLHGTRQSSGMGPARLTRAEIRQWEADEARTLSRWERKTIMAIDELWVRIRNEDYAKQQKRGGKHA